MTNIFHKMHADFSEYTFLTLRPIIDSDMPTMTSRPDSRHTNAAQLRGGCRGRPSAWLGEYKFQLGANSEWVPEWDLVYRDFQALRSEGKPLWYTGSDCTFRLQDDNDLSWAVHKRSKLQEKFGRPSKTTHIVDPRLYEKATFATLSPMCVDKSADGQCGLLEWDEDTTHISIHLGYDDEPEIVAKTFDVSEEDEAVDFFFNLKSLRLPLWYNGAEILEMVKSKTDMYRVIENNL